MSRAHGQRPLAGLAFTIAGILLTTLGGSCSPGGAGSIPVPVPKVAKDKHKGDGGFGPVKPRAGSTRPSPTAPSKH
jgi:hypothetical protein